MEKLPKIVIETNPNNENIIYVDKPIGQTPVELINQLRKQINTESICFSGRLDPLAHGKMLCLLNDETKNVKKYHNHSKVYKFKFVIGLSTDTTDFLGIFLNNNYSENIEMADISKLITHIMNYGGVTFEQAYHIFSSYVPQEKSTNNGKRMPLWWWSMNEPTAKLAEYKKLVTVNKISVDTVSEVSSKDIQKTAITNISSVTQQTFRNKDILEQWENFNKDVQYTEITCTIDVSSGFYIRQFVKDLSNTFGIKMLVTDIDRIEIK